MNAHDLEATSEWVRRWSRLSSLLEQIDNRPGRSLADVLPSFNDSFRSAQALHPTEPSSGLVEQQAVFKRAVRRSNEPKPETQ